MSSGEVKTRFIAETAEAKRNVDEYQKSVKGTEAAADGAAEAMRGTGKEADALATAVKGTGQKAAEAGDKIETAGKDAKRAGDAIKEMGEDSKKASKDSDALASAMKNMAGREGAEKILQISQYLEQMGGILDGIAEKDAKKFQSGIQGAVHAVVGVVGMLAPTWAPFAAALGLGITQIAEWTSGVGEAEEASRKFTEALKGQLDEIERQGRLLKAQAGSDADAVLAAQETTYQKVLALREQALADARENFGTESEEYGKALEERNKLLDEHQIQRAERSAKAEEDRLARQAEFDRLRLEMEQESQQAFLATLAEGEERQASLSQEEIDKRIAAKDQFYADIQEAQANNDATLDEMADAHIESTLAKQDEELQSYETFYKRLGDAAAKAIALRKAQEKKAHDDELKARQDAAAKTFALAQTAAQQLIGEDKKLSAVLLNSVNAYAQGKIAVLSSEVQSEIALLQSASSAKERESILQGLRDKGNMAASIAAAVSFLGPAAPIAAAVLIAAMSALVNKFATSFKFETGGRVADRVPGLGRQDTVSAQLGASEGVLSEAGMNTTLGQLLDSINRGGGGGGNGGRVAAAAAPGDGPHFTASIEVKVSPLFVNATQLAREIGPLLADTLNIFVEKRGGRLVASKVR